MPDQEPTSHGDGDSGAVAIAVVAAAPLIRDGLAIALAEDRRLQVVASLATCDDIDLTRHDALHAVVLVVDDADLDRAVAAARARVSARLVGVHDNLPAHVVEHLAADGFDVLVDVSAGHQAIVDAVLGSRARSLLRWDPPRIGLARLTDREYDVLVRVATGASSREIAAELAISHHTVENYKQRVFRKLGANNQAQAVATALRHGLLTPAIERTW
jgi:DNA-binding NarL/FixJ family response regulator